MRSSSRKMPDPGLRFGVKRTGLASLLCAIVRPGDAKAASVNAESVRLVVGSRSRDIALRDIETVEEKTDWRWAGIRLGYATGAATVSGLSRAEANALADAVETARVHWWRGTLAPQIGMLRSVHDRLAGFADPPRYVDVDILRDLTRDAQAAAGGLVARWPDSLSDAPEIQMLRGILKFLEAPDGARSKANETFVANELVRSRALFDRIEARPLTDEQRKAVVVDERRNLVVAAAGSGKTSVIVAKAGWLVRRGYRKPSDLLLLAFARDARNEMEVRVRSRLGAATADSVTVRTFHSLGMAIIGDAEGKRPALARTAENDRALFDLLKGIVADLLADGILSETVLKWFQDQFAPYRSEHEFAAWGAYWNYIRRNDIRSLKGDTVKSYEECEIANFVYLNGVSYEYEAPYEHETATVEKRQVAARPRHGLHFHSAARARHSAHRVHQEHRDPPQRHELKPPGRQGVVAWRRFPATRTLRPGVRSRPHLHFQSQARALYQPHRSVHERPVPLNPIQDSLDLHPVPLLQVDGSLATPSSQSLERGALSTLSGLSSRAFYPQILLKSRLF